MKRKHLFLAVLAVILVLSASIGAASAYFTTYADARGGYVIHMKYETEIDEQVEGTLKKIKIANNPEGPEDVGKYPVFVRVKVFSGSDSTIEFTGGDGWTKTVLEEGFRYLYNYGEVLYAGDETTVLNIDVTPVPGADLKPGDPIDVIVTYESVPAVFKPDGTPDPATAWMQEDITVIKSA